MEATKIEQREQLSGYNRTSTPLIWQVFEATQWQEVGLDIINDDSAGEARSRLLAAISAEYRLRALRRGHDQQAVIASSIVESLAVHDSRESLCKGLGVQDAMTVDYIFSGIAQEIARKVRPVFSGKNAHSSPATIEGMFNRLYDSYRAAVERREFPDTPLNTILADIAAPFTRKAASGKLLLQHASEEADAAHQFIPVPALQKMLAGIAGRYHLWARTQERPTSEVGHFLMGKLLGNPEQQVLPLTYKGAIAALWEAWGEEGQRYSPEALQEALTAEAKLFREQSINMFNAPRPRRVAAERPDAPPLRIPQRKPKAAEVDPDAEGWLFDEVIEKDPEEDPYAAEEVLQETRLGKDALGDYLRTAGQFPLLTAEQEVALSKAIEAGLFAQDMLDRDELEDATPEELEEIARLGKAAFEKMVNHNLRLVVNVARKHFKEGGHMFLLDAIQEGNKGLMVAVERFDYTKGHKFSTYATWWIRQAVSRSVSEQNRTIRLPLNAQEKIREIKKSMAELESTLGRKPTLDEVAEKAEMKVERVIQYLKAQRDPLSLDAPVLSDSEDLTRYEATKDPGAIDPYESLHDEEQKKEFDKILAALGSEDESFARWFFGVDSGEPKSAQEAARILDISDSAVYIRLKRIRAKLRHPSIRAQFPEALAFLRDKPKHKSSKQERSDDEAAAL